LKMEQTTVEAGPQPCTIGVENYLGWRAVRLGNGILDVAVVPSIGGRILQLRLGGEEYLYVNPRHAGRVYSANENHSAAGWKNYGGSKVWPAPQGWLNDSEWPGPPDPILDGGHYAWEVTENDSTQVALTLTSPPDEYTGLTFRREIRIFSDSATLRIRHTMCNTSLRPVRWALWQVTQQLAGPNFAVFAPARFYRQILGDRPFPLIQANSGGLIRLDYKPQVAKLAVNVKEGWIGSLDSSRGLALIERFGVFRNAPYVDDAPVALWVNGPGTYTVHFDRLLAEDDPNGCDPYVETEVLSPLVSLEPGEEYAFDVWWHCSRILAGSLEKANSCGVVSEDLRVDPENGFFRVTGSFGVFQIGTAELVGICKDGRMATVQTVGPVAPLVPCVLEHRFPAEDSLFRVSLRVRNRSGELLGTIAGARVCAGHELASSLPSVPPDGRHQPIE
jgi:Domain of unknown function (DUF4380)